MARKEQELIELEQRLKEQRERYGIRTNAERVAFAYAYIYIHQEIDKIILQFYLPLSNSVLSKHEKQSNKPKKQKQISFAKKLKLIPEKFWDEYNKICDIRNALAHDPARIFFEKDFPSDGQLWFGFQLLLKLTLHYHTEEIVLKIHGSGVDALNTAIYLNCRCLQRILGDKYEKQINEQILKAKNILQAKIR
ncbi:MAG: hypothetical protein FWE36_08680 [Erysipelotrichales bacterium]|nr:hypothetical protein [Erysipelotrichales bacterium]